MGDAVLVAADNSWPPNAEKRARIVDRMAQNLTALNFLSFTINKTARVTDAQALASATVIEQEAFQAVVNSAHVDISAWRTYAAHCGRRIVDSMRMGPGGSVDMEITEEQFESSANNFDISGGKREFLTESQARELLAPLLAEGANFSKVRLSGKSFGRDAAPVVAAALVNIQKTLRSADLSDIIAGRPEEEALQALRIISAGLGACRLSELDLSDNAFGEKGVRACKEALATQSDLRSLSFCNNGISHQAATAIVECLPTSRNLRQLRFHNNMSGCEGATIMSSLVGGAPLLEDFQLSCSRVGAEGGTAICKQLEAGSSLRTLDLHDNSMGPELGAAMLTLLPLHPKLISLNLSETGMCDDGVKDLAKGLMASCPDLQVLELNCNEITAAAAPALAACIRPKLKLRTLLLAENELGDKGVAAICGGITPEHSALEVLEFMQNELTTAGALAAVKCVLGKPKLAKLGLNANAISNKGIAQIKALLKGSGPTALQALSSLSDNEEDEEEEEEEEEEGLAEEMAAKLVVK